MLIIQFIVHQLCTLNACTITHEGIVSVYHSAMNTKSITSSVVNCIGVIGIIIMV